MGTKVRKLTGWQVSVLKAVAEGKVTIQYDRSKGKYRCLILQPPALPVTVTAVVRELTSYGLVHTRYYEHYRASLSLSLEGRERIARMVAVRGDTIQ